MKNIQEWHRGILELEDIAEAFDDCMDGWVQFLNTQTAEIVKLSEDPYMSCEEDKELWEEIEESDDYVRLPDQYELHEKWIMEHFAYEIGNERDRKNAKHIRNQ